MLAAADPYRSRCSPSSTDGQICEHQAALMLLQIALDTCQTGKFAEAPGIQRLGLSWHLDMLQMSLLSHAQSNLQYNLFVL